MYLSSWSNFDNASTVLNLNGTALPLLNPLTPMAYFSPSLSFDATIAAYILVATLSVMVWDILHTITTDYTLLIKHRITIPTIVYFIARLSAFAFILTTTIFTTAPVGNCQMWAKSIMWSSIIAVPSSSLLFFLRVQALYKDNKIVVAFFFFLWLGVCGGGVISTRGLPGSNIGPTMYCVTRDIPRFAYLQGAVVLVNDTLTLLATSWSLLSHSNIGDKRPFLQRLRTTLVGSNLPTFSRAFLQDGQKYYLATAGFALLVTITLCLDVIPIPFRGVAAVPDVLLLNIMACRVFRNTKLGVYQEGPEATMNRLVAKGIITVGSTDVTHINESSTSNLVYPRAPTPCFDASRGVQPAIVVNYTQSVEKDSSSIIPASYPYTRQPDPHLRTVWYE